MFAVPFVKVSTIIGNATGSGYYFAFGDGFNFGILLAWIIVLLALLISLGTCCVALLVELKVMKPLNLKLEGNMKLICLGGLALFDLVAAILLFLVGPLTDSSGYVAFGPIFAGIMMIFAMLAKCCYALLDRK